jgi:hypothetical protein
MNLPLKSIETLKELADKCFPFDDPCTDLDIEDAYQAFDKDKELLITLASRKTGVSLRGNYDCIVTRFDYLQNLLFYPYMQSLVEEGILTSPSFGTYFKKL